VTDIESLFDVSVVTTPAYTQTSALERSGLTLGSSILPLVGPTTCILTIPTVRA